MAKLAHNGRAAPSKRFLDIEAALRWAYRDELPKRQHGGRYDSRDLTAASMSRLAAADDERPADQREPGFPAAMGDPHPDSIIIETAVKHLGDWAGYCFGDDRMGALTSDLPLDPWSMALDRFIHLDPVATAMEAIAAMAGTIIINARMASRPRWSIETPRVSWVSGPNGVPKVLIDEVFVQVIDRRGRVRYEPVHGEPPADAIWYRETLPSPATRGRQYRPGSYCPLGWRPDPARLLTERAEHCAWHAGLEILAAGLEGQLVATAVLSPAAAWAPWLSSPEDIHGRPPDLFAGLREAPYRCETREQVAARRRMAQRRILYEAEETRRRPAAAKGTRVVRGEC
jgi:hypothetical protein